MNTSNNIPSLFPHPEIHFLWELEGSGLDPLYHQFAIADVLYATGVSVPEEWGYVNPWSVDHTYTRIMEESPYPESLYLDLLECGMIEVPDLVEAGNILKGMISDQS